jgi:hypothetical protein
LQLHEQTQRLILLLIFYLLGPVLTLGIIGGIVLRKLPANARNWERTLTQQTGLHWEIKSVEYRSPGFVRLHEVQILDDTAQRPVFYTEKIDLRRITNTRRDTVFPGIATDFSGKSSAWNGLTSVFTSSLDSFRSEKPFWQITIQKSVLALGNDSYENSALLVQNMLRKVFARLDTLADVPVQLVLDEVYVVSAHSLKRGGDKVEADIFRLVQGNIYRTPAEIRSDWSFDIPNISSTDRLHLSFALSLTDTLEITLRTGGQPIPCDLAAVFYPAFKHFSGGAFQGEFALSTRPGHNAQTIRMHNAFFRNVPLVPLVSSYTDFAVQGTIADLQFDQAVFGTEGIDIVGHLLAQNGAVEKALLHRCIGNFNLTVEAAEPANNPILDSAERMIPFTACSIHFRLQPGGIIFEADQLWFDAFMYYEIERDKAEWILRFPPHRETVTYYELMSIFASDNAPTVPLTHGMQTLVPYVPVPVQ